MTIDRSEVSRALAKAIAYKTCGKDAEAEAWARKLIELLQLSRILAARHPAACFAEQQACLRGERPRIEKDGWISGVLIQK